MNKIFAALFSLFLIGVAHGQLVFSLNKATYQTGEAITVTWSGRTGGFAKDWIGIYPQGTAPGAANSNLWNYVSGTHTATTAKVSGTFNFTNTLANGNWTAYFLQNDGYTILGQVNFSITASGSSRTLTSFTLDKTVYQPGETIRASWTGLTQPVGGDWVGIYPKNMSGVPDGNPTSTIWYYVNNTQTAGTTGAAAGTITFTNPGLPVGEWRAYFLLNGAYQSLGVLDFTVAVPPILAFGADRQFIESSPVTLSWALNPATTVSTLTIGDGTTTTDVLGQETLEVTPQANKTYTLTLNGTITKTARVFKDAASSAAFALSSTVAETANGLTISWTGASAAADSWIGIYRMGETPGPVASLKWFYLNGTTTAGGSNPSGSLNFTNLAAGQYFAVLFSSGYVVEQGPIRFAVADGPFLPFAVTGSGFDQGDFRISWNSQPTKKYDLEASTDLVNWSVIKRDWQAKSGSSTLYAAPTPGVSGEYFRVKEK